MRRAARSAVLAAAILAARAGAEEPVDFTRYVALGDGLTAGFADGNLFDGSTAVPPVRLGQRESYAVRLAESLGAAATLPLVAWPGRPGRQLVTRDPARCRFELELLLARTDAGTGARTDAAARPTIVAVPFQTVLEAIETRWDLDPAVPSSVNTDEDMILGLPAANEGAPPRSQLETAVALRPTFATVWLGVEDLLGVARRGEDRGATAPADFEARIEQVVAALADTGARGAIANVPDVTTFPFFVPRDVVRRLVEEDAGQPVPNLAMRILFGMTRDSYLLGDYQSLTLVGDIGHDREHPPLHDDHVVKHGEARRLRALARAYNAAIARTAERHGWAVVDTASLFAAWRREGVRVAGTKLTTGTLGGLFDMTGQSLSPTGHALVAAEFLRAIDARYGTTHVPPDAAAVFAADPLAPCGAK